MLLVAQGAVAVAVRHVFASTAAVLVAVIPLWVVVLRPAVGDRPDRAACCGSGWGSSASWSWWSHAVPVIASLVGVLVLGEPFRPLVLLGAAVVIAAVAAEVVSRPA
jgi:drug/metabolite transporter (DMT)-like permease